MQFEFGELVSRKRTAFARPHRKQRRDGVRVQAPNRERERVSRGTVEPVRIIDKEQKRTFLGGSGKQRKGRRTNRERRRRLLIRQPERGAERLRLPRLKPLEPGEDRPADLQQRCERQLSLRLHTAGAENAKARCMRSGVLEQRRFTDPRLTHQHKCAAHPLARTVEQRTDTSLLVPARDQHPSPG